ncbi:hypothetical protein [Niastella populi]|uniref:HNH domain-containing protein n=1 Tax=Niastella populi TaxID=550983 RepID=A0A1V9EH16_9BACT|nr:hypothetical protein [Niastella populi]OQP45406.1 hypothetical protein A4R26_32240 [Niastella populi]
MLQIKKTFKRNLDKICDEHYNSIEKYITGRLHLLSKVQQSFIKPKLKEIITATPIGLFDLNEKYIVHCKGKIKNPKMNLSRVINYSWFSNKETKPYNAFELAGKLQVDTCPYCNRNYTVTVGEKSNKIARPDFDHFYPDKQYPLLALSFYNLIPSCLICNRTVKNQKIIMAGEYLHPYEEGYDDALAFRYFAKDVDSALGLDTNIRIRLIENPIQSTKASKAMKNAELFKIVEIYQKSHRGEIAELIRKHHVSSGKYLLGLKQSFPRLGGVDELYRIAFGAYYDADDFEKRPLSKMTKDIVNQLSFLQPPNSIV